MHDVVAHEHGRDKSLAVSVEDVKNLAYQSAFLNVDLGFYFVRRDKSDFHTREESSEY